MFITVRFGDCKEVLFNPNCRIEVLLEDIKKRCQREKEEVIDLSDEVGNLKNLLEHKSEYATDLLKPRHSFILIKVDKKAGEEVSTHTPLLNDIRTITSSFLQQLTRPQSSRSSVSSSSRQQRRKSSTGNWAKARTTVILSGDIKKRRARGAKADKGSHGRESSGLSNLTV